MTLSYAALRSDQGQAVDSERVAAAREVARIEQDLAASGRSLLDDLAPPFTPGDHYPPGEVWDAETSAQYFYHAHPEGERIAGEHGHFHLFLGQSGMPAGMTPLLLPEMALAPPSDSRGRGVGTHRSPRDRGVVSHLIALSVDDGGRPLALFTTNRWVTGETWFRAEDVIRMLPRFRVADEGETATLSRWLVAVLAVLRPRAAELIAERDRSIMDWRRRRSRKEHVFDDRRLEVTSYRPIDFAAELEKALGGKR
jgi:hypothetical protein